MNQELPLRDVHAAVAPDWWPLAPGWWVLAALFLVLAAYGGYRLFRAWRRRQLQKALMQEFESAEQLLQQGRELAFLHELAAFLKRLLIYRIGQASAAGAHGVEWERTLLAVDPDDPELAAAARFVAAEQYQAPERLGQLPVDGLRRLAHRWIERAAAGAAP
ncbi:MAG: DUF4381 domain-containing protein [Xanthomonadales bacterium]|nr:DUF4381 domain-containing protein [Xanthomonadales bacterium]